MTDKRGEVPYEGRRAADGGRGFPGLYWLTFDLSGLLPGISPVCLV